MQEVAKAALRSASLLDGHAVLCCQQALSKLEEQLSCEQALLEQAGICVLPCLGHVDESLLVELAARGAGGVALVSSGCETCAYRSGGELCSRVVKGARNLLATFGSSCAVSLGSRCPQHALEAVLAAAASAERGDASGNSAEDHTMPPSLFPEEADLELLDEDEPAEHSPYDKVGRNGTLSHHIPLKRARLYNCLKRLGQPLVAEVETRLVGAVSIDAQKCMSCTMCAVFCPTGALVREDTDERFGLRHRPSLCMQCRCCEQICSKGAVTVSPTVTLAQFLGKEELFLELERPEWQPNKPDSMYERFQSLIGKDKNVGHF